MRRSIVAAVILLLSSACASREASTRYPKLAATDVVAVAKAPAHDWKNIAIAGAAVGAALTVDDEITRVVRNNDSSLLDDVTDAIEPLGGGHSEKVIAAYLLYDLAAKNAKARNIAFDAFVSSLIASKGITPLLKYGIHRTRPNGGDDESFPSNHATQAFAIASVIATHDDRPWVDGVAYGLATGVAFSRVYHEAHYTSDVIAGAAIGTFVGHVVARTNRNERASWSVSPVVTRDARGMLVSVSW